MEVSLQLQYIVIYSNCPYFSISAVRTSFLDLIFGFHQRGNRDKFNVMNDDIDIRY